MEKILIQASNEISLHLDDEQIEKFIKYKDMLLEYNEKFNLTAITDEKEIALKHFIDSITVCKFIDFKNKSFIDIGTGAGFPAIPIKIYENTSKAVLVDSLNKRVNFLKEVGEHINLTNTEYIHARAEDLAKDVHYREKFDYCISRAVANLASLTEYSLPFVKVGGYFIALKGPAVYEEIEKAEFAVKTLGGEIERVEDVTIPILELNHKLVFIKKVKKTEKKYPRKGTKIIKNPINSI